MTTERQQWIFRLLMMENKQVMVAKSDVADKIKSADDSRIRQ